jgi:hypothetical protein
VVSATDPYGRLTACSKSIYFATSVGGMGWNWLTNFKRCEMKCFFLLLRHCPFFVWKTDPDIGLTLESESSRTRKRNSVCSKFTFVFLLAQFKIVTLTN